jgi:hypothetical protein
LATLSIIGGGSSTTSGNGGGGGDGGAVLTTSGVGVGISMTSTASDGTGESAGKDGAGFANWIRKPTMTAACRQSEAGVAQFCRTDWPRVDCRELDT